MVTVIVCVRYRCDELEEKVISEKLHPMILSEAGEFEVTANGTFRNLTYTGKASLWRAEEIRTIVPAIRKWTAIESISLKTPREIHRRSPTARKGTAKQLVVKLGSKIEQN